MKTHNLYGIYVYCLPEIALLMQSLNFYLYFRCNKFLMLVVCVHEFVTNNHLVTHLVQCLLISAYPRLNLERSSEGLSGLKQIQFSEHLLGNFQHHQL